MFHFPGLMIQSSIFASQYFFSSLWFLRLLSAAIIVAGPNSVAFWNLISFFVEIVVACSVLLSTWTCNLLAFVAGLLLLDLPFHWFVDSFVDLKIILFEGLCQHSALLLMAITNFVAISFSTIREMNLLSKLLWCSSGGTISSPPSPPPPPPILLVPFNKSCLLNLVSWTLDVLWFGWSIPKSCALPST